MLNIPESIKNLFERDDIQKNFRVHFPNGEFEDLTNENIVEESVEFTESLCSQNNFRFGLTEASVLTFETVGTGNIFGMTIEASMEIDISTLTAAEIAEIQAGTYDGALVLESESDIGFGFYRVPYGRFYVDSCPRNHQAMAHRQVTAYSLSQIDTYNIGEMPSNDITFDVATLRECVIKNPESYTPATERTIYDKTFNIADSNATTAPQQLYFGGASTSTSHPDVAAVKFKRFTFALSATANQNQLNEENVIDINFAEDNLFEGNANTYMQKLVSVVPSGFPYGAINIYSGDFKSTGKAINISLSMLTASMYIRYTVWAPGLVTRRTGITMPKPITKSGKYPICLRNEMDAATGKKIQLLSDEYVTGTINVVIPYFIAGTESGLVKVERTAYSGGQPYVTNTYYPADWPLSENHYRADYENISVSGKHITLTNMRMKYTSDTKVEHAGIPAYYDYSTAINSVAFANAVFELYGQFGKISRLSGNIESDSLDNTTAIDVTLSQYSELWWDEYDISPIGTVNIITDALGGLAVEIGTGESYYDMTDNALVKTIADDASLTEVVNVLQNGFAAATENCYFTPAELTMHGKPWIEAGDALSITADDGTEVNTFALRHTLRGIQYITSEIEATSGSIIGVEG